jgi:hypothetical protein
LDWCVERSAVLFANDAKDFEPLHSDHEHAGIIPYREQMLPDTDPEGLARTVDEVFDQYGSAGVENELVDLDEWYDLMHR